MRPIRLLVIMLMGFAGLAACQTTAPTPPVTTADKFAPLAINARRLEIIDNWQMTVEAPYVGHRAQTLPSNLLADWAAQVLQPAGGRERRGAFEADRYIFHTQQHERHSLDC